MLHAAPEAAVGGPLALVRDGDIITLDSAGRRLDLKVDAAELARRKSEWKPPAKPNAAIGAFTSIASRKRAMAPISTSSPAHPTSARDGGGVQN